jgi:hypothetical protein
VSVRSLIAVLGGVVIVYVLGGILEGPLVARLASVRPTSIEELIVVRNEPAVLLGRLAVTGFVGLLAGYVLAKIAGVSEMPHAAASAALQGFIVMRGFATDPGAASVSLAMRLAFVAVAAAAMLAGAAIRARAARVIAQTEVRS